MKTVDMITLSAAHKYALGEKPRNNRFVSFGTLQELCSGHSHKPKQKQGWSFVGDWKRSVAPFYHAH